MTITNDQIVLAESQVMADTDDGGGRMSGEIVDENQVNNTMPDISRLDRVYGRVNLRKTFLSVRSPNQDTLLGAHTILAREPLDPRVVTTLFQTGSHTDRRTEAQNRIESYVVKATEANFWLWGRQLKGQRAISALQRVDDTPPEPNQVYALIFSDETFEQYVRVTEVAVKVQTFTIQVGNGFQEFDLQTLQISLANELSEDFNGSEPYPTGKQSGAGSILSTQVADAAKYYGAMELSAEAVPGDLTAQVGSVYKSLVPSAQSETSLADRLAGPGRLPVVAGSSTKIRVSTATANLDADNYAIYYTGRAIVPGTLEITGENGSYEDDGGTLSHVSGSDRVDKAIVDYAQGVVRIRWTSSGSVNNTVNLDFIPGAAFSQQAYTGSQEITQQTRSLSWVFQARPIPAEGTLIVEYRVLGRWATLRDHGAGVLTGDGTGQVDYSTGTIEITLAGLPDVGTEIIYSWGDDLSFDVQDGSTTAPFSAVEFTIGNQF